jgi:mercuric ion transport protein
MKSWLEKASSVGAVIAAAACPVCFPKLALIGALFGLGALGAYEYQLFIAAQALTVIAMAGHVLAYVRHRNGWLLGGALASGFAVFAGLYLLGWEALVYIGFAGLVGASATGLWNRLRRKSPAPQVNR